MKIVIASDSFKGSLTSAEVADAVEAGIWVWQGVTDPLVARGDVPPSRGWHDLTPPTIPQTQVTIVKMAVADGGEGTAEAVTEALGGNLVTATVSDPLGRPITAQYGIASIDGSQTAIIEMSAASGLPLLSPAERNPLKTSSFGTGELILNALDRGCTNFYIGIGGSATNDGGMGMMYALGAIFRDAQGNELPGRGCDLKAVESIELSRLTPAIKLASFTVACDVNTPFCGPEGAAAVFAPQKGARPGDIPKLEQGMEHFAQKVMECTGVSIRDLAGAGAAGGLGGALKAFLSAELKSGSEMVLEAIGFDKHLKDADLVITGEGRADSQTPKGKTAAAVLRHAKANGVPAILVAGKVNHCPQLDDMGFEALLQAAPEGQNIATSLRKDVARENIIHAITKYFGI